MDACPAWLPHTAALTALKPLTDSFNHQLEEPGQELKRLAAACTKGHEPTELERLRTSLATARQFASACRVLTWDGPVVQACEGLQQAVAVGEAALATAPAH
jgi:hypothetical protein